MKLNLGCGADVLNPAEWINIDVNSTDSRVYTSNIELLADLKFSPMFTGPSGATIELINLLHDITKVKAHHVLEHVSDLDAVMKWIHQISANGAIIDIVVPLGGTLWAVANPDHKRQFNHYTFMYYCKGFETSDLGLFTGYEMIEQRLEDVGIHKFGGVDFQVGNLHTWLKVVK